MKFSRYNLIFNYEEDYLLVNTFSGSLYKINQEIKEIINNQDLSMLNSDIVLDYLQKGIIVEDNVDERRIIKYFQNKEKYCTKVLSLTILLTMECNFRCVYCFEGSKTSHQLYLDEANMEHIKKLVINSLKEDTSIEAVSITLFGGEPLLNLKKCSPWLKDLKNYCENMKKNFYSGIVTNGSLLSEDILDILSECNCRTIQITVDGTQNIHNSRRYYVDGKGSFKDIIAGIKLVHNKQNFPNPVIRINIDKSNIENIPSLLEYFKEEDLTDCKIDFGIIKAGNDENQEYFDKCFNSNELSIIFENLWITMKNLGFNPDIQPFRSNLLCGLYNDKSFTICPDGKVYKCWEYVEDDRFQIGELNKEGIIENIKYHYFDWMTREFSENPACNNCVYLPICGGGCAAVSFGKNKNIHTSGCHKIKGIFETQVKLNYLTCKKMEPNL